MSCGGMQVCGDAESDASSSDHTTDWDGETYWDDAQSVRPSTNMWKWQHTDGRRKSTIIVRRLSNDSNEVSSLGL